MKRIVMVGTLLVVCALMVFTLPVFAASQVRIVRVSYLSGPVEIDRNSGHGFERAIMNMPVTQGTRLQTHDGQAEVEFENGSTVRLTPETRVSFDALSLRDNGSKANSLTVDQGVAYFTLSDKDHNDFKLQFVGSDIELKKSSHFRIEANSSRARIAVFKGELNVLAPGKRVAIHKDQTFSFDPNDTAHYALAKGIDEYQFDSWDRQREQYQAQYARNAYLGGRNAPYYGADDLYYYGAFSNFPGYGYMWRPYGVGYGWDPFSTGYWVWYPSFGYTWVSPYAWGWTPFRYGGWQFMPGYGWYWRPGPWRGGWRPVTPVINPPAGFVPPRPPAASRGVVTIGNPGPVPARVWNRPADQGADNRTGRGPRIAPLPTPNIITGLTKDAPRTVSPARTGVNVSPTPSQPIAPATPRNTVMRQPHGTPSAPAPRATDGATGRSSVGAAPAGRSSGGGSMGASGGGAGSMRGGSMGGGSGRSGGSSAGGRTPR